MPGSSPLVEPGRTQAMISRRLPADHLCHRKAVSLTLQRAAILFSALHRVMGASYLRTGISTASALFPRGENAWNWA